MNINWEEFNPIAALIGGALIGLATALLVIFNGKVAGISGILGALMQVKNTPKGHYLWRILFVSGMLSSGLILNQLSIVPEMKINASFYMLIVAGILVGFGTRMGSGCTSGHGISGLGRLSIRSLIATLSFMIAGFIACYFLQNWII